MSEPAPTRRPGAGHARAISLTGVTRVFGAQPAIIGISLTVERGEIVLLRGANGAGKSTLLRVVATALSPTYGSGVVLGFDLARERAEIRRRTDLLTHRTRLYEELSAAENLGFSCALHGLDPALVPEALERVGLAGAAGERVSGFSHGMRQRVAVARTMLRRAELLLLDEPYAGLDGDAREVVDQVVVAARDAGRTVLLATHEPTRAGLATRTIVLEAGRLHPQPVPSSRSGVPG